MCPCLGGPHRYCPRFRETTKASDNADFGAHSRSFRTCSPTLSRFVLPLTRKAGFRLGWPGLLPGGRRNPLDHYERFQITWSSPLFLSSLTLPHVPLQEPSSASRRLHAGCRPGSNQGPVPPDPRPGSTTSPPVSTSSNTLSTRHQRFAHARLSEPYLTGSSPAFFRNAHHPRLLTDRSLRWFEACP